ncbi:MAG: S-methyl-5-thioribose-1-phosphate isomerase [Planctomycetota bacterium]|nr:S-methyl-5-thioribose-1-phosphate isomerase [Planctomycetota bacterium]
MSTLPFPPTLEWLGDRLRLLDQTRLPAEETYLETRDVASLCDAIKRLVVRGAPAIGCAGAYGVLIAAREARANAGACGTAKPVNWRERFEDLCAQVETSRPTAVNLGWAVERCRARARALLEAGRPIDAIEAALEAEARAIHEEDKAMCEAIGRHGAGLLPRGQATLMTHCNAGALATGGSGTALAVMYAALAQGTKLAVFADETRPLLQGARLTAWELARAGIDVTVICDNMAASVMRARKPDAVIVGADRIAANGDTANKIGTYGLAILAKHHGVPFYVAAPSSTFDLSLADGSGIPIEERARTEISQPQGKLNVPENAGVYNPAFDVTPAELIAAIVTEKGVLRAPYREAIAQTVRP